MGSFVPRGTLPGFSEPSQSDRYDNLAHFSAKILGRPEDESNLRHAFASQHMLTGDGELKYDRWTHDMQLYGYHGGFADEDTMDAVVEGASQ